MLQYSANPAGSYRRIFVAMVSGVVIVWGIVGVPFYFIPKAIDHNPEQKLLWIVTFILMESWLFLWLIPLHFIPMVREFWLSHFSVELTENSVIGRNLWKQPTEIRFGDIVRIQPEPHAKHFRGIPWGLDFTTADGRRIRLHPNVERYDECVEEIRARCRNLGEVNYGGLDKNPKIWTDENKMW